MNDTKRRHVVYTDVSDIDPSPGVELLIENGFSVDVLDANTSDAERRFACQTADAIVVGYEQIDAELMVQNRRLGIIATLSSGTDMVDLEAAESLGVRVCAVPAIAAEEVATHALALILAIERNLSDTHLSTRRGEWDPIRFGSPRRLSETTLGILGLGRIGQRLSSLAQPVFGQIVGFDPLMTDVAGVASIGFSELIESADVISLHLPLTRSTQNLIGKAEFHSMRPGVSIVNVSRGALIDTPALVNALQSGRVGGAGLDVTAPEPLPSDHQLRRMDNVILTPHVAFASASTLNAYALNPAKSIIAWAEGKEWSSMVTSGKSERGSALLADPTD